MITLIEELYTPQERIIIKEFFNQDEELKSAIVEAIGTKIILEKDKILLSKPLDILYMVCLTAKFASSEEECHRVAITVYQHFNKPKISLPMVSEGTDLAFATKTLIALSFHIKALEHRWKYHGAPTPEFYRKISKATFEIHGQRDIAVHHEQWEGFLGEMFV